MNIKQLLENKIFNDKYILKLILQDVFNFSKEDLYLNWDREISIEKYKKIETIYKRYEQDNIPIEYLLGYTFFMGEKFIVNENTLIPRPETEYLVNYALEEIKKDSIIFDIGTGSGIIGINIAKNSNNLVVCSDISEGALEVAQKNKENILGKNENIKFIKSDLGEHINNGELRIENGENENFISVIKNKVDPELNSEGHTLYYPANSEKSGNPVYVICANLPYVEEDFKLDEYAKKEPESALFAGQDGLDLYRKLLDQVIEIKNNDIVVFFELMTKQAETLISEYNDFSFEILDTFHHNIKILKVRKI